jgi:pimeloyl-ACP methyl ester carboxylesterase
MTSPIETTGRTLALPDIEMYVEERGLQRGGEAPLLLLHGFTGCGGDWKHVFDLDALARRHRLIVPDARGHGRSTNPGGAFTHRACAADLIALLDTLELPRVRAIGMSLGANTLLHVATTARERIDAMVLVSATMYYPAQARALMRQAGPENQPPAEWTSMRARHAHGDDQIRALWRHAAGFADSHDDMNLTPPLLGTVTARTLIVYGDRDPLYPIEMAVEMYRAVPRAALRVVPGGGHGPIFGDRERAEFADSALAFLEP